MLAYTDSIFLAQKANSRHTTSFDEGQDLEGAAYIAYLEKRVEEAEKAAKEQKYQFINQTFQAKTQKEMDALIVVITYTILRRPSAALKAHSYQISPSSNDNLAQNIFKTIHQYKASRRKKRYKARRQFLGCNTQCYQDRPEYHLLTLLQDYSFAYPGNVFPSRERLAKELNISTRTADKALKYLQAEGDILVISGKVEYKTNHYYIATEYQKAPLIAPADYKRPSMLHFVLNHKIRKAKCNALKQWLRKLFRRATGQFAHEPLRGVKQFRSLLKKDSKNSFKTSKDPPNDRRKPPHWHLFKDLKLNFKDQWVLSRYSEVVLRLALEDLHKYQAWGNTVRNIAAFLMKQCQTHYEKMKAKEADPTSIKNWLEGYFEARAARFVFITDKSQVDLATSDSRPFIHLMWHKQDLKQSILKVYQKVHGHWIDKIFRFDRTDLVEAIEAYLENSLRYVSGAS